MIQYEFALPNNVGKPVASGAVRPDFAFHADGSSLAVFVEDASPPDSDQVEELLNDAGWTVLRLHPGEDWLARVREHSYVFRRRKGLGTHGIRPWKPGHGPAAANG